MQEPAMIPVPEDDPCPEDETIKLAMAILEKRLKNRVQDELFTAPQEAKDYLYLKLAEREHEVFAALFLSNRHQLIACEELFVGTLNGCSVHPREVVKTALRHNAAVVIFGHNHPSGNPAPSDADKRLTTQLRDALQLVEIRVLDHIVVGHVETVSLAERGLL